MSASSTGDRRLVVVDTALEPELAAHGEAAERFARDVVECLADLVVDAHAFGSAGAGVDAPELVVAFAGGADGPHVAVRKRCTHLATDLLAVRGGPALGRFRRAGADAANVVADLGAAVDACAKCLGAAAIPVQVLCLTTRALPPDAVQSGSPLWDALERCAERKAASTLVSLSLVRALALPPDHAREDAACPGVMPHLLRSAACVSARGEAVLVAADGAQLSAVFRREASRLAPERAAVLRLPSPLPGQPDAATSLRLLVSARLRRLDGLRPVLAALCRCHFRPMARVGPATLRCAHSGGVRATSCAAIAGVVVPATGERRLLNGGPQGWVTLEAPADAATGREAPERAWALAASPFPQAGDTLAVVHAVRLATFDGSLLHGEQLVARAGADPLADDELQHMRGAAMFESVLQTLLRKDAGLLARCVRSGEHFLVLASGGDGAAGSRGAIASIQRVAVAEHMEWRSPCVWAPPMDDAEREHLVPTADVERALAGVATVDYNPLDYSCGAASAWREAVEATRVPPQGPAASEAAAGAGGRTPSSSRKKGAAAAKTSRKRKKPDQQQQQPQKPQPRRGGSGSASFPARLTVAPAE